MRTEKTTVSTSRTQRRAIVLAALATVCALQVMAKSKISRDNLSLDLPVKTQVARAVDLAAKAPHPRLFATDADFGRLKERAKTDELLRMGCNNVTASADLLLNEPPCERIVVGRRLLGVSRTALFRINTLAMAYRLTDEQKYLDRAIKEMRAVCAFKDWNPSHFLDTAEMSLAVATGYDWLYLDIPPIPRKEIADGLRRHGLEASVRNSRWVNAHNNWGQVCNCGILAAALALAEESPYRTARFVQRCLNGLPSSMKALAPNGNYPEGPGYWNYGVEFNVAAMMLLEGTLHSDFGLINQPGFKQTSDYPDLVTGPSGQTFNYADGGWKRGHCFATWWFAKRFNRPHILPRFELPAYRQYCAHPSAHGNRMFVYGLFSVYTPPAASATSAAADSVYPLVWNAGGSVPITVQRSSWDNAKALFVGLKGGSPSANHGHMDCGSFVLDAHGVRWALDLGAESYHKIEQLGLSLWNGAQTSDRWRIFRLGPFSHNLITIDDELQQVKGFGKVLYARHGKGAASEVKLDLSSLYLNAKTVYRYGLMNANGTSYTLLDEISGVRAGARIRWCMNTDAKIEIDGDTATLTKQGHKITVTQCGKFKGEWKAAPAKAPHSYDSPNACQQLTFTVQAKTGGAVKLAVSFNVGN